MRCMTKLVAEAKVGRGSACYGEAANPLVRLLCACLLMGRDKKPDAPGCPDNDNERGSGDTGNYSQFMQSIWLPPGYLFSLERDLNAFLCIFQCLPLVRFYGERRLVRLRGKPPLYKDTDSDSEGKVSKRPHNACSDLLIL